jgi:hypothetical protein
MTIFCDVASCSLVETDPSFRVTASNIRTMTEVIRTSETSLSFYQTPRCNIAESSSKQYLQGKVRVTGNQALWGLPGRTCYVTNLLEVRWTTTCDVRLVSVMKAVTVSEKRESEFVLRHLHKTLTTSTICVAGSKQIATYISEKTHYTSKSEADKCTCFC